MRLGLFIDAAFRADAGGVWCGEELFGFAGFACAVGERFDGFVIIARASEDRDATPYELPEGVELAPLPHYGSLRELGAVLAAVPTTVRALWRSLAGIDLVWVSAANPIGLILFALAAIRRKPTAILVRQDSMAYFRSRLPGPRWRPLLLPLWCVDRLYRVLARRRPTTVVGEAIAADYGSPRANLLTFVVNLVGADQIPAQPRPRDWRDRVTLLTVGRVEPEKNPLLLLEAFRIVDRRSPGRFRLTWVGRGRLEDEARKRAREVGLADQVEFAGYVPFGPSLLRIYRDADAFVHVSLTEGVPGVLYEAMASGLPIVATDVGGVRVTVGDEEAALLVRPRDAEAIADAIGRLDADPELRGRLAANGLERARASSRESQSAAVASFLAGARI